MSPHLHRSYPPARQRGVIMVVALITLVVLMIGAVALIRSMSASMAAAGSYSFKRDMANQAVQAMVNVQTAMATGTLATDTARQSNLAAQNYSAIQLTTTPEGIPIALLTDSEFAKVASATDLTMGQNSSISIRYVIDRLCNALGPATDTNCVLGDNPAPKGASAGSLLGGGNASGALAPKPVYRLTIRVSGPLNAQAFYQSTFTI